MPIKVREPEPPLDFLEMNGQLWEFNREECSPMSPVKDRIVLVNVATGYETSFLAADVKKATPIPVSSHLSADVAISVECLVAESRAVRARWAVESTVA